MASLICVLCCDLVKKFDLSYKKIGDAEAEKLAEILPNLVNLTVTRPDSWFLDVLSSGVLFCVACTPTLVVRES